jgi:hypothetical protein
MTLKVLGICACALAVAAAACEKNSPATPSNVDTTTAAATVVDATTGVTLTVPTPVSPTSNQQIKFADQPVTLTVKNAVSTGKAALTYTFEVATDGAFANKVYSKDGVAEGSGQTSLKIDKLAGDKTYFWRSHATSGSLSGPNSAVRSFVVGPEVVLQAPVPVSPGNGGSASGSPTLVVQNVGRSGPVTQIFYRYEVATSAAFGTLVFANTIAEQAGGQTSLTIALPANTPAGTFFWRVQASDPASGVTSPTSAVFSFRYQPFDMHQAVIVDNPTDLANWGETAHIQSVNFSPGAFEVEFDKRDSPDRWRDQPFGDGSLQYTLGICVNPNGGNQWYCSAPVQFWHGRELSASGPPSEVGRNWFYDGRWNPIVGYQPTNGETVGIFVGSGNLRDQTFGPGTCPMVCERSNVAMVSWHNDDSANFSFGAGPRVIAFKKK